MLEFDGTPKTFLDWLETIECIFDYEEYDDRKRFKLAVNQLTKRASLWYEELRTRRRREGKEKIQSWKKLKNYLKRMFLPIDYEQEEPERLFLETRDPPKPTTIEKSYPYISSFTAFEKEVEKLRKILKEQQEADNAAMRAQQQEDKIVCKTKITSIMSTTIAKEEETETQEAHKQAATSMAKEQEPDAKEESRQGEIETQEERELPITSMEEEEEAKEEKPRDQDAPLQLDDLDLQHIESNLRANSFQEREIDAGARGPKHKAKNGQQTKCKKSNLEGIRPNLEPTNVNIYEPRNNLNRLKYQDPP